MSDHSAWLQPDWPAPPGVRAVTTLRHGLGVSRPPFDKLNLGIRNGDDGEAVAVNRRLLAEALALPSPPRWLRQVHGTAVARFDANGWTVTGSAEAAIPTIGRDIGSDDPVADAAVTADVGTVLSILTADCLPVVFAACDGSEIAAAHAGWRGLAAGVLEATIRAMRTPPQDIRVWLGPAAGPNAYEIDAVVRDAFLSHNSQAASAFTSTRPGHWHVDLYKLARQRLTACGIAPSTIHGGNRCTISEPDQFFSHRRDGTSGRIATLVWIQGVQSCAPNISFRSLVGSRSR